MLIDGIKRMFAKRDSTSGIAARIGIAAGLFSAAVAITKMVSRFLVEEALDRDQPKAIKAFTNMLLDQYSEKEPYRSALAKGYELRNKELETICVSADDGLKLIGHWYPAENPERVILAAHGWRSSWWRDFGASSDFLHGSGCSVLYIEQRGQGNSEGRYMGFGMTERYDILVWLRWICENTDPGLPVYLSGISMGATTVLMASGLGFPDRVKGIAADCGFTSAKDIFRHVAKNRLHLAYSIHKGDIEYLCREKISHGTEDYSTLDALSVNTVPVLFVHGTDDSFVPVRMTYDNYKACKAPKRLFVVPGAEHGGSYLVDRSGYERELLEFWAEYDRTTP